MNERWKFCAYCYICCVVEIKSVAFFYWWPSSNAILNGRLQFNFNHLISTHTTPTSSTISYASTILSRNDLSEIVLLKMDEWDGRTDGYESMTSICVMTSFTLHHSLSIHYFNHFSLNVNTHHLNHLHRATSYSNTLLLCSVCSSFNLYVSLLWTIDVKWERERW